MKKIGIISDTHSLFDQTIREFLADVDEIWHAGDFGNLALADTIANFKPLRGVYGNIDGTETRAVFKEFNFFECDGVKVLMTHIGGYPNRYDKRAYAKIMQLRPDVFIAGHSHILKVMYDKKLSLLHINPGACGMTGFHKVRTALRCTVQDGKLCDMELGEWPRERLIRP